MRLAARVRAVGPSVAVATLVGLALTGCGDVQPSGGATPTVTISPTTSVTSVTSASTAATPSTPSTPSTSPTGTPDPGDPVPLPTATTLGKVTLSGIPERGVEPSCLLLDRYLLIGGDRTLLSSGVPVTVTGHRQRDVMSFCQQGIYLVVDTVVRAG